MKRIRTRSIPNVDTERLLGRLRYVGAHRFELAERMGQKVDVRALAREVVNIERELARRGVLFTPVTNGHHLLIDVEAVREVRPPPSWEERREMLRERAIARERAQGYTWAQVARRLNLPHHVLTRWLRRERHGR